MRRERLQEFNLRISQASKTELIVIMYDIVLEDIECAKEALDTGDEKTYLHDLKHAQRFLNELMANLNYTYSISYSLMSLYIFLNKQCIIAEREKEKERLDDIADIVKTLRESFAEVSKQDFSGPMMKNTQQVYAGLTYGRGTLNETYLDPTQYNRGFKA